METSKHSILGGLVWSFAERFLAQLVSAVVGVILARLLEPDDYGLISIVLVFISFCNVFVTAGFSSAIVQKKNADESDYNTAFIISLFIAVFLYGCLFVAAPHIAEAYRKPQLSALIRVLGMQLIILSWNSIQQAQIRRHMNFRYLFKASISGTAVSCCVGVAMAYCGFGAWSLVAQQMTNVCINTIVLHFEGAWRPRVQFSAKKAREIYSFGWKVLCTQLIATLQTDIRSLIVGLEFGTVDLAYYEQGNKYPSLLMSNVTATIAKVMLPAFSKEQDHIQILKGMLRKAVQMGMFLIAPILLGFFAVADTFVMCVLTETWAPIIPFLQVFCIIYLTRPFEELCHQTLISLGRADVAMRIIICINIAAISSVLVAIYWFRSVYALAVLMLVQMCVSILGFGRALNRIVGYRLTEQISDILPSVCIAAVMGMVVSQLRLLKLSSIALLLLQIIVGALVYIALSWLLKRKEFFTLWNILLRFVHRKHGEKRKEDWNVC